MSRSTNFRIDLLCLLYVYYFVILTGKIRDATIVATNEVLLYMYMCVCACVCVCVCVCMYMRVCQQEYLWVVYYAVQGFVVTLCGSCWCMLVASGNSLHAISPCLLGGGGPNVRGHCLWAFVM